MMSSTIRTWRPVMSVSRSLRIRTTPEDLVPEPYDDTAIQSISTCRLEAPGQVGHHHHRAPEDADQQEVVALVVALDVLGQLAEPVLDLLLGVEDVDEVALDVAVRPCASACHSRPGRLGVRLEHQRPVAAYAVTWPGSSTAPWPCQPLISSSRADVAVASSPRGRRRERREPEHPRADRRRARSRGARRTGPPSRSAGVRRVGELVEGVQVLAEQVGGAGQGRGDTRAELAPPAPAARRADPRAGEARVVVVRVLPPEVDALRAAGRLGLGAGQVEQRAAEHARTPRRMPASDRPPEPRVSPSSTVSAWSSRVCPSSTARRRAARRAARGRRTGPRRAAASGPCPRASTVTRIVDGLVGAQRGHLRDHAGACSADAVLQPVVDGHADHRPRPLARLEDGGGEQGQRVGAARSTRRGRRRSPASTVGQRPAYGEAGPPRRPGASGQRAAGSAVHAADPGRRVGDLVLGRQVGAARPTPC